TLLPVRTHISEDLGKSFTNKIAKINEDRRRGKPRLPHSEEAGVNGVNPTGVNGVDSCSEAIQVGQEPPDRPSDESAAGVNRVNPNYTHGLHHEQDSPLAADLPVGEVRVAHIARDSDSVPNPAALQASPESDAPTPLPPSPAREHLTGVTTELQHLIIDAW